jgi:hypothetical protein
MKRALAVTVLAMSLVVAVTVLAMSLVVAGCGSKRLTDQQYQEICLAYHAGQSLGNGAQFALNYEIEHMHLSRSDAAEALAVARREYCP